MSDDAQLSTPGDPSRAGDGVLPVDAAGQSGSSQSDGPGEKVPAKFGPKTKAFLAAIAIMPNVSWGSAAAGIRRELHYRRLKKSPAYRAAFEEAWAMGCGALQDRAMVRAMEGVEEPVFWRGEECGRITRYYHTEFLLRGAMPQKYSQRMEHGGIGGSPIEAKLEVVFRSAPVPDENRVP